MKTSLVILMMLFFACKEEAPKGWKSWVVNSDPIFQGQFSLVGDPSVLKESGKYRMFYTGFDAYRNPQGPEICQATSQDGLTWSNVIVNDKVEGRMLNASTNNWSNAHETCYVIKRNNLYYLYFIGYQDKGGGVFGSGAVSIGLATSSTGENFVASQATPVIESSPNGLDRDAMTSPALSTYRDSLIMIYAGFCYTQCGSSITTNLLAAMSSDGITWVKKSKPIIAKEEVPWASKGVSEAELILGPDNLYYLFMMSIDEPNVIGVARSTTPFGPWDVNPIPIIKADKTFSTKGAVAPSVLIEGQRVRLWYHGATTNKLQIGYAETTWPLKN